MKQTRKIIILLVIGLLLTPGLAQAQEDELADPGMTPDSPFYFLEEIFETLGTAVTFDEVKRAERYERLAEERLSEARAVAERGLERFAERTIQRYQRFLELAVEKAEEADAEGRDTEAIKNRVLAATEKHQAVLERVLAQVPEQAKPAIRRAYEASLNGQVAALRALSSDDSEEALERARVRIEEHLDEIRHRLDDETDEARDRTGLRLKALEKMHEGLARIAEHGREDVRERIEILISQRLSDMDDLEEDLEEGRGDLLERLREARGRSVRHHIDILRKLAESDPAEAARRFEEAADRRLQRAENNAQSNEDDDAEVNVAEYEEYAKFGKEISELARNLRTGDTTVDELVERATSRHLDVLRRVMNRVPDEARDTIERVIRDSEQRREQINRAREDMLRRIEEERDGAESSNQDADEDFQRNREPADDANTDIEEFRSALDQLNADDQPESLDTRQGR